jgi:heterodisulfide reductase subunit D
MTPSGSSLDERRRAFVEKWKESAYLCFSSGHKFCRDVCPVSQVTQNENHSPTAFHTNVVAMEQGLLEIGDIAADYINCTGCGGCEIRCPNTLEAGDFYRSRVRTVDIVKAMRALAVDSGIQQPAWQRWVEATMDRTHEPVLDVPIDPARVADWAIGLDIPIGGETILFADCEAAFYRTSVPRATALVLAKAGFAFGLMREQWCCGGPAAEMGYVDHARLMARHNVDDWRAVGAKRIITLDPHDYITFTEDYPSYFGAEYDFEIVHVTELVADLVESGRLVLDVPVERSATYHDPCRLNKRKGIWESPRTILRAIPGLTFHDVNHVAQWSFCSGAGGGLMVERPDLTAEISRRRVAAAAELDIDTLVSACVWSERPLSAQGALATPSIDVRDLMELVAEAAGFGVLPRPGE